MVGRDGSFNSLKQRDIQLFHITAGSFSRQRQQKSNREFLLWIFATSCLIAFSTNPLSDSALKKQPDLSIFQIFSDEYFAVNSSSVSIQEVIISSETSPASPKVQRSLIV